MKALRCSAIAMLLMSLAQSVDAAPLDLALKRTSLTNVDDSAGRWQFEGGKVFQGNKQVANYASIKRVVVGGTDDQNTATASMTIFFLGKKPPENITLQGSHDFNSGNETGSVSAASAQFSSHIGKTYTRMNDTLTIK
jgi:hypothetical protein